MNHRFGLIPILLFLGLVLVACGETTAVATPTAPPPAPTITVSTPATTVPTPTSPPPAAEQQDSDAGPSLEVEDFGLAEWQVLVMEQIPFRGAQGQDLGTLYDWYTTEQATDETRESALRLVNLLLTPGHAVELPQRLVAEEIMMDPAASDNPLNRDQIVLRVDGTGAPDENTGIVYVYNSRALEVDGEMKTTPELLQEFEDAQTLEERQKAIELARQSALLVYTPGEVGGRVQTAVVGNNVIMQRVNPEGDVVQSTDNSALNWKVGLTPEQVVLGEDEENPYYHLENVNGGAEEGARTVFWEEDQKALPPAEFDTQGLRLSVVDGKPAYVDSEGNTVAILSGRSAESAGTWEMVERASERRVTLPEFSYEPLVFRLSVDGDRRPEVRNTLPGDVQYYPGRLYTAEEMNQAFQNAGIELQEGQACSTGPNDQGRYDVHGLVLGFRDGLMLKIQDDDVDRNSVWVQLCGRDPNGNVNRIIIETAYTITHYPDENKGRMIMPGGREIAIRQRFTDEMKQQLIGSVFTYRGKGIYDGSGVNYTQWMNDMVNPIRSGSEALQTGEYPTVNAPNTVSAFGSVWIEFIFDGRNLTPNQ
jgi:hypothetical protein